MLKRKLKFEGSEQAVEKLEKEKSKLDKEEGKKLEGKTDESSPDPESRTKHSNDLLT